MDTAAVILAVASPPGRSVRGIVRLSGARTFELLAPHLDDGSAGAANHERAAEAAQHDFDRRRGIRRAVLRLKRRELACLMTAQRGPRSYTGEDCVELQLPGNPTLLDAVVDALIESAGDRGLEARRAGPGEFTARAFLHGRLGLTEAEGVAATIAARSDAELRAARMLLTGQLGEFARGMAEELASALALVEAGIDFTDQEDVVPVGAGDLRTHLLELHGRLVSRLERTVGFEKLEAIPWVVLTGPPNAGKSTLFNALLGRDRAVVSRIAGTTRDVLTEPLIVPTDHGPAEVMLVDLAGADAAASDLDHAMQDAARQAVARAELVLQCAECGDGDDRTDAAAIDFDASALRVATKTDLARSSRARSAGGSRGTRDAGSAMRVAVSARTGDGIAALREMIGRQLSDRAVSVAADTLVIGPRHEEAMRTAADNLHEAIALTERSTTGDALHDVELIASTMRSALDALALLAGDISPDDVLGRIFAGFCVGK